LAEEIPRLVLGPAERAVPPDGGLPPLSRPGSDGNPFARYLVSLRQSEEFWQREVRVLLAAIIREGRRFALTPEGARWKAFLADSTLVRNGWLAWNASGLDFLLRSEDETEFTPSQLWQQITAGLAALEVEPFLTRLTEDLSYYHAQAGGEK
jgi:hypothetical protein